MREEPLVIAHMGASGLAPENTVPAVAKAVESGADIIELDCQATLDDVPVCIHDVRLERTTGDRRRVRKVDLEELRDLDAGAWFGEEFKGARVPTLEEALEAAGDRGVIIKLRELAAGSRFESAVRAAVEGRFGRRILAVPDSDAIARSEGWTGVERAFLADEKMPGWLLLEKSEKLGLTVLRTFREHADRKLMHEAKERGMEVLVFYADEEKDMRELVDIGADGIVTNRPDRLREMLEGRPGR
jgi:glycerophosphoryl diester phosphodiesterase